MSLNLLPQLNHYLVNLRLVLIVCTLLLYYCSLLFYLPGSISHPNTVFHQHLLKLFQLNGPVAVSIELLKNVLRLCLINLRIQCPQQTKKLLLLEGSGLRVLQPIE